MNIAIISSFMGPYYSNYVASMIALEKALQNRGHRAIYIFPTNVERFSWVDKFREATDRLFFIEYAPHKVSNLLTIRRLLKQEKIDIVYTRMGGWDLMARFARPFLPVVWHIDMAVNISPRSRWLKQWMKYKVLALWNTHIATVSEAAAKNLNSFSLKYPVEFIPNVLDLTRLRIRQGLRITTSAIKNLLIFAYDPINKGLDKTLDALEVLNANGVKYRLLVSAQRDTYKYMKARYSVSPEWVVLLLPTDDVASLYEQADAMLIPSLSEGFSYCLGEAIYTGLPVICSNIPGNQWAFGFHKIFSCEPRNAEDLQRAILEFSCDDITEEEQKDNRNTMERQYSLNAWTDKVIDYLESVLRET